MEKKDIINCINNGFTAAEMAVKLKIHDLDLYREINKLKNEGYTLSRKYYSDGNFKYTFDANYHMNDKEINIITNPNEKEVKVLCMSDLHYTSRFQNLDMVHRAYDYAKKNGIKLVFIGGDILHGKFGQDERSFEDGIIQIEKFINDYPFSNDILTFGVGGDHDESIYFTEHINPIKVISSRRHDIVIPNYVYSPLRIKGARIQLNHKYLDDGIHQHMSSYIKIPTNEYEISLNGHSHKYDFIDFGERININLPTTSNMNPTINGFIELTLNFNTEGRLNYVSSRYITYINGKEVTLVYNGGCVNYVYNKVNNIENYTHKVINNPFKPSKFKNDDEIISSLNDEVTNVKNKLENVLSDNEKLTSALNDANEETERLRKVVSSSKHNRTEKNQKINKLETENKRISDSNKQLTENNKKLNDDNKSLKEANKELLEELKEYKALLGEYKKNSENQIIEENKLNSLDEKQEKEDNNINVLICEKGSLLSNEALKVVIEEHLEVVAPYSEKILDAMDNATLELCGEEKKKSLLKNEKLSKKNKRLINSQMSKQDRIEELKNKFANKRR